MSIERQLAPYASPSGDWNSRRTMGSTRRPAVTISSANKHDAVHVAA